MHELPCWFVHAPTGPPVIVVPTARQSRKVARLGGGEFARPVALAMMVHQQAYEKKEYKCTFICAGESTALLCKQVHAEEYLTADAPRDERSASPSWYENC